MLWKLDLQLILRKIQSICVLYGRLDLFDVHPNVQEMLSMAPQGTDYCIRLASGGYYGLCMSTMPQCVEIFQLPLYNKRLYRESSQICSICSSLRKVGWEYFGLILKNNMAATAVSLMVLKECVVIFLLPI